jgi:hypothetical protein
VFVIFLVAGVAIHRGVLVPILRVAGFASHFRMFALQRVFGLIVVEPNDLPGLLRMAIRARFSDPTFVFIVLFVAAVTRCRRIPEFDLRLVAGLTFDLLGVGMGAAEDEIGS